MLVPLVRRTQDRFPSAPVADDNLFQRLIRNPTPMGRPPRERECTEMLCALLRNAPALREGVLKWLAERAGWNGADQIPDLDFEIETECDVDGKRDDLRIEGWTGQEDRRRRVLLWTVEVKVSAGFHGSSLILPGGRGDGEVGGAIHGPTSGSDDAPGPVLQLVNYDGWLGRQDAEHREGFVLAPSNLEDEKPKELQYTWPCLTWWKLAETVAVVLEDPILDTWERKLGWHFVGFVDQHLREGGGMLDFEDVGLMMAYATLGATCRKKVDDLVGTLIPLLKGSEIAYGEVKAQQTMFGSRCRSIVYRSLDPLGERIPWLCAGIVTEGGTDVALWIETKPNFEHKQKLWSALSAQMDELRRRDDRWRASPPEDRQWWDLDVRMPVVKLLAAGDQEAAIQEFVRSALGALEEIGTREIIKSLV